MGYNQDLTEHEMNEIHTNCGTRTLTGAKKNQIKAGIPLKFKFKSKVAVISHMKIN